MKIEKKDFQSFDEEKAFNALIEMFSDAMYDKLIKKKNQGYNGWCEKENFQNLLTGFRSHLEKDYTNENLIDIAIYSMLIWNLENGDY